MSRQKFIAVAGNMGSGKSTLVQFLSAQFGGEAFYEPVDTNPFFNRFFNNMRSWAFHSQIYFLVQKYRIHQKILEKSNLVILDRTIYEDAEIFARGLFNSRKITQDEFNLYWDLYNSLCQNLRPPDCIIYLTCDLKIIRKRVRSRGRVAEKKASLSYVKNLQKRYDDWVSKIKFSKIIHIPTDNLDYISDLVHRADIISRLSPHLDC